MDIFRPQEIQWIKEAWGLAFKMLSPSCSGTRSSRRPPIVFVITIYLVRQAMVNLVDRQAGHVLGRLEARTDGRTRLPSIRDLSDSGSGIEVPGGEHLEASKAR